MSWCQRIMRDDWLTRAPPGAAQLGHAVPGAAASRDAGAAAQPHGHDVAALPQHLGGRAGRCAHARRAQARGEMCLKDMDGRPRCIPPSRLCWAAIVSGSAGPAVWDYPRACAAQRGGWLLLSKLRL
jgi:hypothetical protein